ncbi:hypothetical protein [Streptomyces parvulus]|uniref:Uncharacterized protein n=1 Tax=Streptomyces parvulus TaxID=146923 RepID=A0A369VD73_9ACTN|nr:hypothetical protein [Streptomyces parvulus]RDD90443.1 hypothetical protein DVZ84_03545 [Streptomyces parvulus]
MTPSLRTARGCRAAAVLLLAAAWYAGSHHPWLAVPGLYAAGVMAWCAAREGAEHRRRTALARRAELLARPNAGRPLALDPCCAFWRHSDGAVHGPDCTRPAAARVSLGAGCCEVWWTSLGTAHDAACPVGAEASERNRSHRTPR